MPFLGSMLLSHNFSTQSLFYRKNGNILIFLHQHVKIYKRNFYEKYFFLTLMQPPFPLLFLLRNSEFEHEKL
jgi:hypothetical protein